MLWNEIYRILSMEVDVKAVCQEVTDTRTLIVSLFLEIELCFTDPHLRQFSTVFAYVLYIRSIDKHTMSIERMDFVLRRKRK